jgi:sulfite exporter TauE/SafE
MGLAGAGHCVGMCGGFVLAVGREVRGVPSLAGRHLAYHAGKTLTYVFLAVLISAGFGVVGRAQWFSAGQTVLALVAGGIMVAYGAGQLFEVRAAAWWKRFIEPLPACRSLGAIVSAPGPASAFATGWLNGFLPCGLLLSVLFYLASSQTVLGAASGAALFGAATFPGLFLFGLAANRWKPASRRKLVKLTGAFLVFFGIITLVRAFPEGRHWLHEIFMPSLISTIRDWCGL